MSFYMNYDTFNEGEQADAYKKKKLDRMLNDKNGISADRSFNHYFMKNGNIHDDRNPNATEKGKVEDAKRQAKADDMMARKMMQDFEDHNCKGYRGTDDYRAAADAANKHMRRHPEAYKEFGIFAEACFMNE